MLPTGWQKLSLEKCLNIEARKAYIQDNQEYDLVTVKRSRGGVIRREHLKGKDISVKSQFYIKEGDFLISKRQIVHGACGLVPKELSGSIVSNEYCVLTGKSGFYLPYMEFLSESLYFQQTCFHSSIGVHIEKMIFKLDSWFKWPFNIPPLSEQKRIVKILSTWDKAISVTEKLLANSQQQKKALMQQLLTGKKRLLDENGERFSGDWNSSKLGDLFNFKKGKGLSKSDLSESGINKCILYGELYTKYAEIAYEVISRTNSSDGQLSEPGDILLPASTTTSGIDLANATALSEGGILLGGDINILRPKVRLSSPFLAYFLTHMKKNEISSRAQGITIIHLYGGDLKSIDIVLPSTVQEQQKIATVLSAADAEISILEKKLACLKDEKKALMQQLLTGKRRVKVDEAVAV